MRLFREKSQKETILCKLKKLIEKNTRKIRPIVGIIMALSGMLLLLGIIVGYCTLFALVITISAYMRHRAKKTPVTKALLFMFAFILIAVTASLVTVFFEFPPLYNDEVVGDLLKVSDPVEIMLTLTNTFFYQLAVIFTLLGFYCWVAFARLVFFGGEDKRRPIIKLVKIVVFIAIVIQLLVYVLLLYLIIGFTSGVPLDRDLLLLSASTLPLVVAIIQLALYLCIMLPTLIRAIQVQHRLSIDDPHRSNFLYLGVMAFFFLLMMGFNLLDMVLLVLGEDYPTLAFIVFWLIVSAALYAGYRGFFSTKS